MRSGVVETLGKPVLVSRRGKTGKGIPAGRVVWCARGTAPHTTRLSAALSPPPLTLARPAQPHPAAAPSLPPCAPPFLLAQPPSSLPPMPSLSLM